MKQFIAKFEEHIEGTLSGFDRVVFRGSLRRLTHPDGLPVEHISDPKANKEEMARALAAKHNVQKGDVCALTAMELTPTFRHRKKAMAVRFRLRAHGLIQKVPETHRYQVTKTGRLAIAAILTMQQTSISQLNRAA